MRDSITFPEILEIKHSTFSLVDVQRSGKSAIYNDKSRYLRIGIGPGISNDLHLHKQMQTFGFPVAKLLDEGQHEGMLYFIEESLGDEHFGEIFKNDISASGEISGSSFQQFIDVSKKFVESQVKTITTKPNWESFKIGIHLDKIVEELPEQADAIMLRYEKVEERLGAFPTGLLHGDFGPFNMYPKGIIDLESSFFGPVGYDIGSIMEFSNWFPESPHDGYYQTYKFTDEQKVRFYEIMDRVYIERDLPKISDYTSEFNFVKGIWFAVGMDHLPNLQKFRFKVLTSLL
ncbi:MAG: phosphotransferase [Candidatus Doudnabacteria bacterium]|nr:phosphotransferase [Candidatus Doudnabacteria bacterium]